MALNVNFGLVCPKDTVPDVPGHLFRYYSANIREKKLSLTTHINKLYFCCFVCLFACLLCFFFWHQWHDISATAHHVTAYYNICVDNTIPTRTMRCFPLTSYGWPVSWRSCCTRRKSLQAQRQGATEEWAERYRSYERGRRWKGKSWSVSSSRVMYGMCGQSWKRSLASSRWEIRPMEAWIGPITWTCFSKTSAQEEAQHLPLLPPGIQTSQPPRTYSSPVTTLQSSQEFNIFVCALNIKKRWNLPLLSRPVCLSPGLLKRQRGETEPEQVQMVSTLKTWQPEQSSYVRFYNTF